MSAARKIIRCRWVGSDPLMIAYHDDEWGVPVHDDRVLFEMLTLEGAQAGLSWLTVLRKRERYREVFSGFDVRRVARYSPARIERLLRDPGIVRNRLKVESTVTNARAILELQRGIGSFATYLWSFVKGQPVLSARQRPDDLPAKTPLSARMSRDLGKRGFRFVGPTICYAFMQAVGLVNDHAADCFRHAQLRADWRRIRS